MYTKKAHIHFIGIGGIGMSGIATILKIQGYTISGCDLDLTQQSIINLKKLGCIIYQGNNTPTCQHDDIDIVVYSSAISPENNEIQQARLRNIPTIPRALMLAELMRTKYSIAIAGSHGKTTTTSLISHILIDAQQDPTVIIGGHLKSLSSNARFGNGDFIVAEADESDRSFLHLHATLALITNIDLEHLETYKNIEDIKETFIQFIHNIPFYGKVFLCTDDPIVRSILPMPHLKTITYSFDQTSDFYATRSRLLPLETHFDVWHQQKFLGSITMNLLGRHNILNALGAIALCTDLGISFKSIARAIGSFKGVDRRFSYRGSYKGCELFDDYGHHPNEIACTLEIARKRCHNNLVVIFQPHRYSRTHHLWQSFVDLFAHAPIDTLIITDIYGAHEEPIPEISAQNLVLAIKKCNPNQKVIYVPYEYTFSGIINSLDPIITQNDLILLLGAGRMTLLPNYLSNVSFLPCS